MPSEVLKRRLSIRQICSVRCARYPPRLSQQRLLKVPARRRGWGEKTVHRFFVPAVVPLAAIFIWATMDGGDLEQWSVGDERPYLRPERSSFAWPLWIAAIAFTAGIVAYYYHYILNQEARPPAEATAVLPPTAAPAESAEAAIRHPLEGPLPEAAASLPGLDNSDSLLRDSLAGLMGRRAFEDFVLPDRLVRRIVATIDNLPRPTAPRRMIPLNPVPGAFVTTGAEGEASIDAANFERYAPYVRVLQAVDARALVKLYVAGYPLFQRAYEELGYPGKYFNDRLIETIDDLLAAPELSAPVAILRPRILYEFADPDLETRSAGQKILIRVGPENARKVKAKLLEIRRALLAAQQRMP